MQLIGWILIIVLSLVLLAAAIVGIWLLLRHRAYRKGVLGKQRVHALLRKFGVIRNYRILRDVKVSVNGRTAQIDHMLIGFFGILFVSTLNDTAEYYGTAKEKTWTKITPAGRVQMENLELKNQRDIDVVREIFSKHGVYNIKMEGAVVFCGNRNKSLMGITGSSTLMDFRTFKAYLYKSKFEKDNDVDVPALEKLISEHMI